MELRDRLKRETDWQEKAFRISGRHRDALADAIGTPPNLDNVPESLWRQIEDDWAALLVLMLLTTAIANAAQHGRDISVGADNATAGDWARGAGQSRGADFADNTRKALEVKAREWRDRANRGEPVTRDELRNTLDDWLAQRGRRLIETEFTTASVWGAEFGTALAGVTSDDDEWKTNPHLSASGPCPVCAPLNGRRRPEWTGDFPSGPPAHPGCVCEVLYARLGQIP